MNHPQMTQMGADGEKHLHPKTSAQTCVIRGCIPRIHSKGDRRMVYTPHVTTATSLFGVIILPPFACSYQGPTPEECISVTGPSNPDGSNGDSRL